MAQRQHVQKANGVEDALVFTVFGNLPVNGIYTGQDVAVRQHYAARLRRGSGREDYLGSVIARERGWSI